MEPLLYVAGYIAAMFALACIVGRLCDLNSKKGPELTPEELAERLLEELESE